MGIIRTCSPLIIKNAMGVIVTPAPEPPPKGLSRFAARFFGTKSDPPPAKPKETFEIGRIVTPSGVWIGSPMMALAPIISRILLMVVSIIFPRG